MATEKPSPKENNARPRRNVRKFHRWGGLLLSLPILWLSLTGILLNHADELGLNTKKVTSSALLNHYNQLPQGTPRGLLIGDRLISEWDRLLFLDQTLLPHLTGTLIGASPHQSDLAIATTDRIQLYDAEGTPTDLIDEITLPALSSSEISGIQTTPDGYLAIQIKENAQWWIFDQALTTATKATPESSPLPPPQQVIPLTPSQAEQVQATLASTAQIPYSRVILDAHSGRLFGNLGKWFTSLIALLIIGLTLSGLKLFAKRNPRTTSNNNQS